MKLENYFNNGYISIWQETFAIIKAKKIAEDAFANIVDKNETTVIIEQSKINNIKSYEIEKDWKIITFNMILPFNLIGFIAKITNILADKKIAVFVISAYSTDHILVKEKDLTLTIETLMSLGLNTKEDFIK